MSNFYLKAKNKKTGEIEKFFAMDDYYGKHNYGYQTEDRSGNPKVFDQFDFDEEYEVIKDMEQNPNKENRCEHQGECYKKTHSGSSQPFGYCKYAPRKYNCEPCLDTGCYLCHSPKQTEEKEIPEWSEKIFLPIVDWYQKGFTDGFKHSPKNPHNFETVSRAIFEEQMKNTENSIKQQLSSLISQSKKEERDKIKQIFNKCKTERGLSRALSNYLTNQNE